MSSRESEGTVRTEELVRIDREHVLHPLCPIGDNIGIVFEEAHGVTLRDTEGREYIDGGSQLCNVNLGHGRMAIVEAAMAQGKKLQYVSAYYGYTTPALAECSRMLSELTPPGLDHFVYGSGGSDAVECAMKLARVYWQLQGQNKHKIISLYNSYHGSSFGAVSATAAFGGSFWKGAYPLVPGFVHIPTYYCYRCPFGLKHPECGIKCAHFLDDVIQSEGVDSVAAFIAEPVQGGGGIVTPPPEYWPIVREICTKYDVLLIADEVMTGFGRTGKMFALEHWDVKPDIMTVAKGITSGYFPFGAAALDDRVFEVLRGTNFQHGLTYSGHPICAAAAVKTMQIYLEEKVVEHVASLGEHTSRRLEREFMPLPHVGTAGGLGLFQAVEMVADKVTKEPVSPEAMAQLQKQLRDKGLWMRFSHSRFHICPPLTITMEEMDRLLDIMKAEIARLDQSS